MNDFDTFLESELRELLDPLTATRPPGRREHARSPKTPEVLVVHPVGLLADAAPAVVAPIPRLVP